MERVFTKASKQYGTVYPAQVTEYQVEIVKGKMITIHNDKTERQISFNVGDQAEYDSYNLSYYGPIVAITAKRVTVISRHDARRHAAGEKVKKHSLDLNTFCFRNHNFDLNKTVEENFETSMSI
jgi:hypothetical protein